MKIVVLKNNQYLSEFSAPDSSVEEGFEAFIGRSEDCHVMIDDPLVSRHMLVLRYENGKWNLEKLGQLGVVALNGNTLGADAGVASGDLLTFGPYSVLLDSLPGAVAAPARPARAVPDEADDLPPAEELEGTALMGAETKVAATPDFPEDDLGAPLDSELDATVAVASADAPTETVRNHAIDDLGFGGGEEDVIGSTVSEEPDPLAAEETQVDETPAEGDAFGDALTDVDNQLVDAPPENTSTQLVQRFVSYELQLFGEFAPYDVYKVETTETFIGRDSKKCQIVLNDSEVSSVHAVLRKTGNTLVIEDLNSSNGTLLNGQRINKSDLTNSDEIVIGSTTLTVRITSDLLQAESGRLMPVQAGQVIERVEEIEEEVPVGAEGEFATQEGPPEKSIIKRIWKDPKKKRIAVILIVALMLLSLLEDEAPAPQPEPKKEEKKAEVKPAKPGKRVLTSEELQALEARYKIAEALIRDKKLDEALAELEQIIAVDGDYKSARTLYKYVQEQNTKLKEEQERLKQEAAKAKLQEQVKGLLAEARTAVNEHNATRAEQLFTEVLTLDPENLEVTPLRQELEAWQLQQKLEAEAKARKEAERKRQVDLLAPGKALYLRKEWYKATVKLDEFIQMKQMDEDLIKEASDMLADARTQLASEVAPLLGKARSLKEGQDLKGAYEAYLDVLKVDPINSEALNEVDSIRETLEVRSKKVYREAIISESLSLFSDAKEKLQEVQQISPTDSEYYKKASEKLKDYLE